MLYSYLNEITAVYVASYTMAEEQGHSEEEHFEEEHFAEEHFEEEYEVEEHEEEHFEEEHIEEEGGRVEYNTPLRAKKSKLAGASKYGCRYQPKWEQEFPFINRGIQDSVYISFYCKVCQRDTSCHQGITDLKGHENSAEERVFFNGAKKQDFLSPKPWARQNTAKPAYCQTGN